MNVLGGRLPVGCTPMAEDLHGILHRRAHSFLAASCDPQGMSAVEQDLKAR